MCCFFFLIHHADISVIAIISFARVIVSLLSPKLHFWNMSEELHLSSLFSLCLLQIIFILNILIKGRPFFIVDPWKLAAGIIFINCFLINGVLQLLYSYVHPENKFLHTPDFLQFFCSKSKVSEFRKFALTRGVYHN